jgi:hypothetical protein
MTLEYLLACGEAHGDCFWGVDVDVLGLHHSDICFCCYFGVGRHLSHAEDLNIMAICQKIKNQD